MPVIHDSSPLRQPPTAQDMALDQHGPTGPMSPFLGRRFTVEDIFDEDYNDAEELPFLKRIVAYEVPSLIGTRFEISRLGNLSATLQRHLNEHIPGANFVIERDPSGIMRRYQFFHLSTNPIQDEKTGIEMWLELKGALVELDGLAAGTSAWSEMMEKYRDAYWEAVHSELPLPPFDGKMVLRIDVATYANVRNPGVGVGIYV